MALLRNYKYDGPGWQDWLLSFASSVLIAAEIKTQAGRETLQSTASYYFAEPNVPLFHQAALIIDIAILAFVALWIVSPWKKASQTVLITLAGAGIGVCWSEAINAAQLQTDSVYVLSGLPFFPLNNIGIVGAQLFGTYLLFKIPTRGLKKIAEILIKVALAFCFWFAQTFAWQLVIPS